MSALNQPFVLIDNEVVKYQANSVKYKDGSGEVNTRALQLGGGATEPLHTPNGETMISEIMITLDATTENESLKDGLSLKKASGELFVLQIIEGDSARVFPKCMLVNHSEVGFGQDGTIELEIKGEKII